MKLFKHFATILCVMHSATGQGLFDFFGFGMGGGTADLFGPAQTFDPWMSGGGGGMGGGGGGMNGGMFGGGFGAGTGGGGTFDPAAQDARLTMAEEQMAEVMGESPRNSPERQRIDNLIQASGGQFTGDAAPLNYLVQDYLMTTPGPAVPQQPAPVAGGKQAGGKRLQKQRRRNRNGQGRRNNGVGNRRNRNGNGRNRQAGAGAQQPPPYPTAAGKLGTRNRRPRKRLQTNMNKAPANHDPLYQPQPTANNQNYQPQPTAYQDPMYQPQPTANYQNYQSQSTAYQDPLYQPQPTAYQDPMYQSQPPANNQNYQPQPPVNNQNYQPQPPANNQNYQPQPPANNQNYQQQPPANIQNYQPQPPANNQNYQPQPPANNQNYQPQPPANNQNYQPQPPANNQNYQPQPPANNQNYQPQPPANNQNYKPQPPAYHDPMYQSQPSSKFNNQMYQAEPHASNGNYQSQLQNYPAQQPHGQTFRQGPPVNQPVSQQRAQTKTKAAARSSKGSTKRVTKKSVTKSRQDNGPIAVNRLKGIEGRIASVKDQLFHAQQMNDVAQIQNLQGQLEALNGVKNILTGGTANTNKMETIKGRPVGKSPGPSKQAPSKASQRPYGPPKLNRNNRSGNNNNNPKNFNSFQETNVGGQLIQTWKEKPQRVQNNVHRQPSTQVNLAKYHNAAPSPDPYAPPYDQQFPAYDQGMNNLQPYDMNTLAYDQGMNQPGGGFANNAPRRRKQKQRKGKGKRRGFQRAPTPPTPTTPAGTTVPPKLGDVRWVGNEQYIYYDADGFDTFQWVKKSTVPAGQLDHLQQNQAAQEGAPAQEGAAAAAA